MVAVPIAEELDDLLEFPPDTSWRRKLQPLGARRHPGKLHLGFLAYLLDRYVTPGMIVCDRMAGSGSILAATLPPWQARVIANELEPQWFMQMVETWHWMQAGLLPPADHGPAHRQRALFAPSGSARLLCGDARDLNARLAGGTDVELFSPPYADALGPGHVGAGLQAYLAEQRPCRQTGLIPGTSYANGGPNTLLRDPTYDGLQIDVELLSPPYEDALAWQRHTGDSREREERFSKSGVESRIAMRHGYGTPTPGRRDPQQIGNLAGRRYQAAMTEVYAASVAALRPGGRQILILKNIVRKGREVDLVAQAIAQCEALGMRLETIHWRRITKTGPFHAIRRKKDPNALVIDREAAIVLRKPGGTR